MTYTDHSYRTLPRIANSDLSELERIATGKPPFSVSQAALDFGTAFHTLILEPENVLLWPSDTEHIDVLFAMKESILYSPELCYLFSQSDREVVRLWDDPETGLPCKGKIDAIVLPRQRHLIDLKTTSCRTKAEFEKSITAYGYDRQAAFYLDSDLDTAKYFEFIAVCKVAPYPVFRVALHKNSDVVEQGRSKNRRLLQRADEELGDVDGWRPSAWSRIERPV